MWERENESSLQRNGYTDRTRDKRREEEKETEADRQKDRKRERERKRMDFGVKLWSRGRKKEKEEGSLGRVSQGNGI